jgi:hypothetical protein
MAVGDLVSNGYGVTTSFQPAATVQICITQFFGTDDDSRIGGKGDINSSGIPIYMGTGGNYSQFSVRYWNGRTFKWFIDNSSYLEYQFSAGNGVVGFSGIQTQ